MVFQLYRLIYGDELTMANLDEMAENLSQIARRERMWTGKFLHSLIKGYDGFKVSCQLQEALDKLERHAKGLEPLLLKTDDLPKGVVLIRQPRECALIGCDVVFVPGSWNQKYCRKQHAQKARNLRRKR